jgi:hypothetical protein
VILVLAALVAAAVVAYRRWDRAAEPVTPVPAVGTAPPAEGTPSTAREEDPAAPVDPAQARALLEEVSPHDLYRRAISDEEFVRRTAVVIDNLGEGVSPRRQLELLAPGKPFTTSKGADGDVIAPASYARYDAFADAVSSVDAAALARAYRALRAPLRAAYQALGHPDVSLDAAVSRALGRIEAAPVFDAEVRVADEGGVFVLVDPRLESLRAVEKHLLRMGPRNTRLLQRKAAELRAALQLPASPSGAQAR